MCTHRLWNALALFAAFAGCASPDTVNIGRSSGRGSAEAGATAGSARAAVPVVSNPTVSVLPPTGGAAVTPGAGNRGMGGNAGSTPAPVGANTPSTPNTDPNIDPTPVVIDQTGADNPAGLSATDVTKLMGGGPLGDLKWLYPYADTVFPRGTQAPLIMWNGSNSADAVYLRMRSKFFEYKGVLKADEIEKPITTFVAAVNAAAEVTKKWTGKQVQIPQTIWELAGQETRGRDDPFELELIERANGSVRGAIRSRFYIAQADIKGSIYYSSCSSSMDFGGPRILVIPPGGKAQTVPQQAGQADTRCQGCHAVSANGSRLLAQRAVLGDVGGRSYSLHADGSADPFEGIPAGPNGAYAALYPDGSQFLTTAIPQHVTDGNDPNYGLQFVGYISVWGGVAYDATMDRPATLYDTNTGTVTPNAGIPAGALMPMFSPDGRYLVFNDLSTHGYGLAVMDYDVAVHKASGYRIVFQETETGLFRPGWPAFLPDNKGVVFVRTKSTGFIGYGNRTDGGARAATAEDPFPWYAPSDLYIADVASGTTTLLAKAMGFDSQADFDAGTTYLVNGAIDLHHNYFPTVSQVAAGGFFWVFFDTFRHYGNLGITRGIWGFALDVKPNGYTTDPSHPPFYLPGQEFNVGNNHRALVALDPCKSEGDSCTSAINCCEGTTCSFENATTTERGLTVGRCAPPPPPPPTTCTTCTPPPPCTTCSTCSKLDERCTAQRDCCDASSYCINGFCAIVGPE